MDTELKERLSKYLDGIESTVKNVGDVAMDQLPDIAQQYISWCFWSSIAFMCIGLFILIGTQIIGYFLRKVSYTMEYRDPREMTYVCGWLCPIFGSIVSLIMIFTNMMLPIQCIVAPKLVLLEKLMTVIR
jgi:hypothetical protein